MKESAAVLLRTTADIVERALNQMECLAEELPEYSADTTRLRTISERVSEAAGHAGRLGQPKQARRKR